VIGSRADAGSPSGGAGSTDTSGRTQRYNYLVGRLRNRQITMEEATELFTIMQTMLARANELARAAAFRAPAATPAIPGTAAPTAPRLAPAPASADDFLVFGILAMGAGAGLLAALSKRIGDASPPAPSGSARSTPGSAPP
jgi:hypothetical protein